LAEHPKHRYRRQKGLAMTCLATSAMPRRSRSTARTSTSDTYAPNSLAPMAPRWTSPATNRPGPSIFVPSRRSAGPRTHRLGGTFAVSPAERAAQRAVARFASRSVPRSVFWSRQGRREGHAHQRIPWRRPLLLPSEHRQKTFRLPLKRPGTCTSRARRSRAPGYSLATVLVNPCKSLERTL